MSLYGLKKMQSRVWRTDTIHDLHIVNEWRVSKGMDAKSPKGPSVRLLENCVAKAIEGLDTTDLPKLVRGLSFYMSILPEIKS